MGVDDELLDVGGGVADLGQEREVAGLVWRAVAPAGLLHGLLEGGGHLGEQDERQAGLSGCCSR